MDKKVSIIIPVYNSAKTINKCVESLENGTYKNIEIILIDDCSLDNSNQLCMELVNNYSNILLYRNEQNRGVSYTRNVGLSHSSGDYLCFVDSDDWVDCNYIEKLLNSITFSSSNMAICGYVNHDEIHNNSTDYFSCTKAKELEIINGTEKLLELFHNRLLQQLWNKIFLSHIVKSNHICFDESLSMGEDFRFILDYLSSLGNMRMVLMNDFLYHYIRDKDDSLMSTLSEDDFRESMKNIEKLVSLLKLNDNEEIRILTNEKKLKSDVYAYVVMHSKSLSLINKIKEIKNIEQISNTKVLKSSLSIYVKEKISGFIKPSK